MANIKIIIIIIIIIIPLQFLLSITKRHNEHESTYVCYIYISSQVNFNRISNASKKNAGPFQTTCDPITSPGHLRGFNSSSVDASNKLIFAICSRFASWSCCFVPTVFWPISNAKIIVNPVQIHFCLLSYCFHGEI